MAIPDPNKKPTGYAVTASAAPAIPKPAAVPNPDQAAHQAYINSSTSGQGGLDAYTKTQNDRWQAANASGDSDLMGRLQADSQRVGYALNPYQAKVPSPTTTPTPTVQTNTSGPTQYAEWQAKQNELMANYEKLANANFQYNPDTDPQYQAYRQLANSRAASATADANRNTLETMNDRGIINSTVSSSQLSQNENKYRQQAESEALAQIPQYYAQARTDYQDKLRNAASMLNFAAGRGDQAYNQEYQAGRDKVTDARADAELTGNYTNPNEANIRKQMDANSAAYPTASPAEKERLHAENVRLAASIGGQDTTGNGDYAYAPVRTLQGQQVDYNQQSDQRDYEYKQYRDQISDEQYKQKFDEDVRRDGLDRALQKAVQFGQLQISQQNANTSAASAGNSASNAQINQLMDTWDRTGVAPAGIPGVAPGTPLRDKPSSTTQQNKIDYKSNPDFADSIKFIDDNPDTAATELTANSKDLIAKYGYDGYQELRKYAGL